MQSLLSYALALKEDCRVHFVNSLIINIAGYMMSSNFLAANSRAT